MLRQEQIAVVIDAQKEAFLKKDADLIREALPAVPVINSFATMITGVRRCGKSTLLLQVLRSRYKDALYFNFEDIRLVGFEASDFTRFQQEIVQRDTRVLFLDEIQLVEKWEIFVHQLLREGYTIFITGSNASMLSRALGTHLTGRHVSMELFPFSYFKDAYLIEFMPQFSYSLKAQARNPKKIYAVDTGLITAASTTFTDDTGHRLENLVYLHLRRQYKELYYFKEKGECDFVAFNKGKAVRAVQVCYRIEDTNFEREYNGLLEAMKFFKLSEGVIITFGQKDRFEKEGYSIELVPAHEYMAGA